MASATDMRQKLHQGFLNFKNEMDATSIIFLIIVVVFFGSFLVFPLISIVAAAFFVNNELSFQYFIDVLKDKDYLNLDLNALFYLFGVVISLLASRSLVKMYQERNQNDSIFSYRSISFFIIFGVLIAFLLSLALALDTTVTLVLFFLIGLVCGVFISIAARIALVLVINISSKIFGFKKRKKIEFQVSFYSEAIEFIFLGLLSFFVIWLGMVVGAQSRPLLDFRIIVSLVIQVSIQVILSFVLISVVKFLFQTNNKEKEKLFRFIRVLAIISIGTVIVTGTEVLLSLYSSITGIIGYPVIESDIYFLFAALIFIIQSSLQGIDTSPTGREISRTFRNFIKIVIISVVSIPVIFLVNVLINFFDGSYSQSKSSLLLYSLILTIVITLLYQIWSSFSQRNDFRSASFWEPVTNKSIFLLVGVIPVVMLNFDEIASWTPRFFNLIQVTPTDYMLILSGIEGSTLVNTLIVALGTTAFSAIIGVSLAFIVARYEFIGKTVFRVLILFPLVVPPFVGAIGVRRLLTEQWSTINLLFYHELHLIPWIIKIEGLLAVIIIQSIHFYTLIYLNSLSSFLNIDPSQEEQAENLGAKGYQLFRSITLPLALPGIAAGAVLTFILSVEDLGTPLIFSGDPQIDNLLTMQVYRNLFTLQGNLVGSTLAMGVILLLIAICGFALIRKYVSLREYAMMTKGSAGNIRTRNISAAATLTIWGLTSILLVVALIPHIGTTLLSITTPQGWISTRNVLPTILSLDLLMSNIGDAIRSIIIPISWVAFWSVGYIIYKLTKQKKVDRKGMLLGIITFFGIVFPVLFSLILPTVQMSFGELITTIIGAIGHDIVSFANYIVTWKGIGLLEITTITLTMIFVLVVLLRTATRNALDHLQSEEKIALVIKGLLFSSLLGFYALFTMYNQRGIFLDLSVLLELFEWIDFLGLTPFALIIQLISLLLAVTFGLYIIYSLYNSTNNRIKAAIAIILLGAIGIWYPLLDMLGAWQTISSILGQRLWGFILVEYITLFVVFFLAISLFRSTREAIDLLSQEEKSIFLIKSVILAILVVISLILTVSIHLGITGIIFYQLDFELSQDAIFIDETGLLFIIFLLVIIASYFVAKSLYEEISQRLSVVACLGLLTSIGLWKPFLRFVGPSLELIDIPGEYNLIIFRTIAISFIAVAIIVILGIAAAYILARKKFPGKIVMDSMVTSPIAIPGVVLGIGYLVFSLALIGPAILTDNTINFFGLFELSGGEIFFLIHIILVVSFTIRRFPFTVRAAYAGMLQTHETFEEASYNLGAGQIETLRRITLPLIVASVFAGAMISFVYALAEVSTSMILLGNRDQATIPWMIKDLYEDPIGGTGPFQAASLGMILLILQLIVITISNSILKRRGGAITGI
ncbi:MAG: ABC transporter permease [Candidatus Hodarchaeales archaeon]|jgi:ABC-type Fe3+ transport system permease subunit